MILQNKLRYLNILIVKIIKYFFQIIINFYIKENQKFFLQKMEFGLTEVILGYRVDELVRLIVVLGSGGVLAEILDDNSVRIAPVELSDAMEMIEEVKALSIINGYRCMPKGDIFSLAKAIVSISKLSFNKKIKEAEINPLIIKNDGKGVVAVDGLIVLKIND
jgi:succinyl-CoA synthetase beta subunit